MYAIPSYEDISVILPQYYRTPVLLDTTVTLNTDFFPWVSYGYFAGDYPAGITTLEGVPTDASITILTRAHGMRWDAMPVRRVKSGEDGIWRAEGIDPGLRYRVMGDKEGYNSVIADNVEPMNLPQLLPDRYEITVAKPFELEPRIVGGIGDITLTHINGMLPQGVTLTDGVLHSEWPTGETGDYPLEFELVDEEQTNIAAMTLALGIIPLSIDWESRVSQDVAAGFGIDLSARVDGGEGPYTITVTGDIPNGVSVNTDSAGVITFTGEIDDGIGVYSFTVTAEDVRGSVVTLEHAMNVGVDPHWDKVVALLPLNGDFTEKSHGLSVAAENNPAFYSGPFDGVQSVLLGGRSAKQSIHISPTGLEYLDGADFTIELYINHRSYPGSEQYAGIFASRRTTGINNSMHFRHNGRNNSIEISMSSDGTQSNLLSAEYRDRPAIGRWEHLALVREGDVVSMYIDGIKRSSNSVTGSLYGQVQGWRIGHSNTPVAGTNFLDAYVAGFRITKGVARYSGDFNPPILPYPEEGI